MNVRATSAASALAGLIVAAPALAQDTPDTETFPFEAYLSGAQEPTPPDAPTTPSPGVVSTGSGEFNMQVAQDLSSINFTLTATITGATQAHLHCGRPGENGPVVVPLMTPNDQGMDVSDAMLGQGEITNATIVATAEGCQDAIGRPVRNVASLAAAALEGLIYANVHTVANPAGEIRGQLISGGDEEEEIPPPTTPPSTKRR